MDETFILKVLRGEEGKQYFEEFELKRRYSLNVIAVLMELQRHPYNRLGQKVTPVVWDQGCLEEVCGACSMLVNGEPRQACSAMIETLLQESRSRTVVLAPLTKFPLIRDLCVDRNRLFKSLKKVKGWIDTSGTATDDFGPHIAPSKQESMYTLSTCMTCGCCAEVCPQFKKGGDFVGPQAISQVRLFNMHPTGKMNRASRLHALMKKGGITQCGNAQACVQVCPKKIPLTESIALMGRDVNTQAFRDLFSLPERD